MKRFASWRFSVLGCAALAAGVAGALFGGWVAIAQVRVEGELGWQGHAVAGVVNPLTITVENAGNSVLAAALRVEQDVGSGWRGRAMQRLTAPILLAPGGRRRLVFPWPVEAGSDPIKIVVESEGAELARLSLPLRLGVEKPVAVVGGVAEWPSLGPVVFLASEDLPNDPVLLSSFSEVRVAPTVFVPGGARDALAAWVAFAGGGVSGLPAPEALSPLRDDDLRQALRDHGPRPAPVGVLLGGTGFYLLGLGYALASGSRRSWSWAGFAFLLALCAFALFYPVMFGFPQTVTSLQFSITRWDIARYSRDVLVVVLRRGGLWEVDGWWLERVPAGSARIGRTVDWVWGGDGVRTVVQVDPGQPLFLWRYGTPWTGAGVEHVVGRNGMFSVDEAGFAPLVAAVQPSLREGDRVVLGQAAERRGGLAWYAYRLRWERRG